MFSIRIYPDAVLRKKARRVGKFNLPSAVLVEEMFATMYGAKGVGLAANQVGLDCSLAVVDVSAGRDPRSRLVLINPEIVQQRGQVLEREGCLSIPGLAADLYRAEIVRVRAWDQEGRVFEVEGTGLLGQALQHEVGHLNGKLYIDYLPQVQKALLSGQLKKMRKGR